MTSLTLSQLNCMICQAFALTFPEDYWVVAEISELHEGKGGHCYMELVEKDGETDIQRIAKDRSMHSNTSIKAKAKANIWSNVWLRLKPQFLRATGQPLSVGMKVLVKVHVTFHEQYGYSLNVRELDSSYSIGEMTRHKQEIINRLAEEGVMELNRQLTFPRPLRRIAVISAANAAGYGDFCMQLEESGLHFHIRLFPAAMQGQMVESSVIKALDIIAQESEKWDCVVIIRGGGAVADLNDFNTYLLAVNVAQFPLPVITGIGHDRDETVVDIVAHTPLKTPTAVAQFLIDTMLVELELLKQYEERLQHACLECLRVKQKQFDGICRRYERATYSFCSMQHRLLMHIFATLRTISVTRLKLLWQKHKAVEPGLRLHTGSLLSHQRQRLCFIEKTLQMASPEHILKLGFSITTDADGHLVRHPDDVKTGGLVFTQLQGGSMHSIKVDSSNTPLKADTPQ